ncbi:hypothetical protein [Nocardia aurantia]|uniref:WXG100 family type VII secretion target n=1 Tax=Nocardia aurantia TaxID=2585199 RepID=A0A7K0DGP3_9NOCA|nr:hypothetical protein [Nocardia aurantia]MQY24986.1 hypothetical protein [Nocardia aurantia]
MTSGAIVVYPDRLADAGRRLSGSGTGSAQGELAAIVGDLTTRLDNYGSQTWGDDSYGKKFADGHDGYLAARDNLLTGGTEMAAAIGSVGRGLIAAAGNFTDNEASGRDRFRNLRG